MIKEIRLPLKDYTKYKNISKGMFAISELYLVSLPKFDSKKVFKCNIFLCEDRQFPTKEKILGFAISYQFFDFKKYLSLNEEDRKFMVLQVIHQGMLDIAADYNWDTEPLEEAYQSCLTSDLTFKRQIKKRKLSPNRKQYLSLWAYCDQHYFKITWTTSDKKGEIVKQGTLLTEQPSYIDIWYSLNFHWIDDEHFIVESNYKGLISDTWEVDISNGAVLATNRF